MANEHDAFNGKLTMHLTEDEWKKLWALSEYRKKSVADCIRDWVRSIQVDGTGYVPKGSVRDNG